MKKNSKGMGCLWKATTSLETQPEIYVAADFIDEVTSLLMTQGYAAFVSSITRVGVVLAV